jgi:hypothetical protein
MNCQAYCHGNQDPNFVTRRWFFKDCAVGLGSLALMELLAGQAKASPADPLAPKLPHHAARAKRVVFLFMAGAPSQLELFDYRPQLARYDGTLPPADLIKGYRAAFIKPSSKLLGPKFKFAKHGRCGAELSELLPNLAKVVDDIAIVKSLVTDAFNHAPAQIVMNTGVQQFGRPSFGAWATYGLGSECRDLPGFVVLNSGKKGPSGVDAEVQRDSLEAIERLNRVRLGVVGDPEISTRINAYEMAFRMQATAPELMDIAREPKPVLDMYGAEPGKPSFANNCLLARRLLERGVRFVQLFHEAWDQHSGLKHDLKKNCEDTDRASAALVKDLKQRGLLDDTLVIWGGEFGRTPMVEGGGNDGRDHHPNAFTMWLAGGGIKPGLTLGSTDEFGFNAVEDRVHVHDLHATLLHLLGFDHTRLTFKFQGRDFRLTDVHGKVVDKLLA